MFVKRFFLFKPVKAKKQQLILSSILFLSVLTRNKIWNGTFSWRQFGGCSNWTKNLKDMRKICSQLDRHVKIKRLFLFLYKCQEYLSRSHPRNIGCCSTVLAPTLVRGFESLSFLSWKIAQKWSNGYPCSISKLRWAKRIGSFPELLLLPGLVR